MTHGWTMPGSMTTTSRYEDRHGILTGKTEITQSQTRVKSPPQLNNYDGAFAVTFA